MNRAWKLLSILSLVPILMTSGMIASDVHFGDWPLSDSTRNIPAGTVVDPGSQLLYIVDTGINISKAVANGTITEADALAKNVNGLLGITGASGEVQTNFISVTNTHPTKAVTVHFRYFNDECEDVLDFLVILTCNDTLILNPFDFQIPAALLGGNPINTKSRIFGPDLSDAFPAISGEKFASGRFLIFATAAATVRLDTPTESQLSGGGPGYKVRTTGGMAVFHSVTQKMLKAPDINQWDWAASSGNILFPFELGVALDQECNIDATGVAFRAPKDGTGATSTRNVGSVGGLSPNNLHVFNASGANFNYLIGHKATAVPKGFIAGAQSDQDLFLAFGVNAWTRPAVNASRGSVSNKTGFMNGDGPTLGSLNVPDYTILMGSEILMTASDTTTFLTTMPNNYYLRQEAHGGDTARAVAGEGSAPSADGARVVSSGAASEIGGAAQANWADDSVTTTDDTGSGSGVGVGGTSHYGSLAWISLHGTDPDNQIMHLLSFVDDYSGSKNTGVVATISGVNIFDRAYNLTGAQTRYILQIYDNDENKLDITTTTPINISPPPTIAATADLRIIVDCLNVWINGVKDPATLRHGLTVGDLYDITAEVETGSGDFKGLGFAVDPLTDASQGWIRLVRDNNATLSRTYGTRTVTITAGTIAPIDHVIMDNLGPPSFVTIGEINTRFEGYGAAWWAATAAQALVTSDAPVINPSP